jgi:hypothetical protein
MGGMETIGQHQVPTGFITEEWAAVGSRARVDAPVQRKLCAYREANSITLIVHYTD